MKKVIQLLAVLCLAVATASAQTTILDFEAAATSTTFQYFGSSLEGELNQVVANPNPTGINTSANVSEMVRPANALNYAGSFTAPNPTTAVDCAANGKMTIKVHMDHIGTVTLKMEEPIGGGSNWAVTKANTVMNGWEEIEFSFSEPSFEAPNNTASGLTYQKIVIFFDLSVVGGASDVVSYVDDLVAHPGAPVMDTEIYNFENLTGNFTYFGSGLDGTMNQVIANPNSSGINTSAMVAEFVKPGDAVTWAGAFSDPNPAPIDVSAGGQICVKVHMDHIGNLALKLENDPVGDPNWIQQVSNTKVGEWEELCFDLSLPSLEPPNTAATGVFEKLVLFFDFGVAGTGADVTSYFDDIVLKGSTGPQIRTVNFAVDMNSYTEDFDTVYVSGTFNNWNGTANPLTDADFDGIWEGSITVAGGLYEYKVTLDDWNVQEEFDGVEECTVTDGAFTNRRLLVSGDKDVPLHCFNSCYACGLERKINIRLGMGNVVPSPDGVWLAGGGNFDAPGGRYKMQDDDNDGIWEITVPRKVGFASFYAFANGPCPDYSCKEDLTGLPCGDPGNFNDRWLPALSSDTTIATCYGACFTNADCTSGALNLVKDASLFSLQGNPVSASAILNFGADLREDIQITLNNTLGQQVKQLQIAASTQQYVLQTSELAPGLYYLTVQSGERFYTEKVVKSNF